MNFEVWWGIGECTKQKAHDFLKPFFLIFPHTTFFGIFCINKIPLRLNNLRGLSQLQKLAQVTRVIPHLYILMWDYSRCGTWIISNNTFNGNLFLVECIDQNCQDIQQKPIFIMFIDKIFSLIRFCQNTLFPSYWQHRKKRWREGGREVWREGSCECNKQYKPNTVLYHGVNAAQYTCHIWIVFNPVRRQYIKQLTSNGPIMHQFVPKHWYVMTSITFVEFSEHTSK